MSTNSHSTERERLREQIYTTLARSPQFAGRYFRIEMSEDAVVLKGIVRSYYHKQLAQETLRPLTGRLRVQNELQVINTRR